tara:strand:- start:210 stop:386 length:177 start_codon:yes stop_codon:yes gene_type:complete
MKKETEILEEIATSLEHLTFRGPGNVPGTTEKIAIELKTLNETMVSIRDVLQVMYETM